MWSSLRTRILIPILLFRFPPNLRQLLLLLLELRLLLQPLLISLIHNLALTWHRAALLYRWPAVHALPPLLQILELVELDSGEIGHIDPTEVRDVGDGVFVANKVVAGCEAGIEDAV